MKRLQTIDLARGFAVLTLAPIHCMMIFGSNETQYSLLGGIFHFLGEGPAAQLFMLVMGTSLALSSKKNWREIFKRSGILLLTGYVLNVVKFVIPMLSNLLPLSLLAELGVKNDSEGLIQVLLLGDILQFAGIAMILLYVVSLSEYANYIALGLAAVICLISPFVYDLQSEIPGLNYLLQLLGGKPPRVFFPLFPWLVYSLVGFFMGYYLKKGYTVIFQWAGMCGLLLIFIPFDVHVSFYRTQPTGTLVHLGIVLIWLYIWHLLEIYVKNNRLFTGFIYLSHRITSIYVIQWILILWLVPVFGYRTLSIPEIVCCILLVTTCTLLLQRIVDAIKGRTATLRTH